MTSTTGKNVVSDFIERHHQALDQLREHLVSDLRISKQLREKLLIHLVYAGLGFRAIRDILPLGNMKLETYLSKSDWKDDFEQDMPYLKGYLAIGDAFEYDPSYLNILSRANCLTLIPSEQKKGQTSVQEQLSEWRRKGVKIESMKDLFRAAERGLLHDLSGREPAAVPQHESTGDVSPVVAGVLAQPVPRIWGEETAEPAKRLDNFDTVGIDAQSTPDPAVLSFGHTEQTADTQAERAESHENSDINTDPSPEPEPSAPPPVAPISVEERIFQSRLRELQGLCKTFSKARALFIDTQNRFKPLSEWGDTLIVLKENLLPCQDMIRQLSEV